MTYSLLRPLTQAAKTRTAGLIGFFCLGLLLPMAAVRPVAAAERVTITYGFIEISTTVAALREYADTGVANRELNSYLNFLSEAQRSQFRRTLQARQDVDPVQISQFLYSALGENILRSVGGIIQTQGRRDGAKGLRGALVLAAAEPEGLSLLGVLEQFPTNNVRIDSQRAFQVFNAFTGLIQETDRALAAITAQSSPPLLSNPETALATLSATGPYEVAMQTLNLVDGERDRTLPTDLYLPTEGPSAGVIVISHGLAGDRRGFAAVAEHLASYGYAVAAIEHPGSNTERLYALFRGTEQEVADPSEFSDRPRDVSFLLDELTRMNEASGPLANRLDLSKVGIIGHSFGGYTALALSGARLDFNNLQANCTSEEFVYNGANPSMLLQCTALLDPEQFEYDLRDERIQAVIALNPVTSSLFGPQGFSQLEVPSLMVAGSGDPVAPALLEQIRPFTWLNEADAEEPSNLDHYLALIEGGSHLYDPIDITGADRVRFAGQLVNADTPLAYSYLKALSLGFMEAEINQNVLYRTALEDATILQIGQQPLPLYLVRELTEAMLNPAPEPMLTPPNAPEPGVAPTEVPPVE